MKAPNIVDKYHELNMKLYQIHTMVNEQKREFNQLSELNNHVLSMRSPLQSNIKEMEKDLRSLGTRIIESNISVDQYDGYNELIKE